MELLEMLRVKWCWLSTFIALFASIYLVRHILLYSLTSINSWFVAINVLLFILLFSLSFSCTIRNIRLKIKEARSLSIKEGGKGIINLLLYVIGFTALQSCVVSGMCGVNLALPLLAMVFPFSISSIFMRYGEWVLLFINILLILSLLSMKCFSSRNNRNKDEVMMKVKFP